MSFWKRTVWALGLVLLPVFASAQTYVRLHPQFTSDLINSAADSITVTNAGVGGFGIVKIQTLDTYSGTWEVQCSVNGTTFDTATELKLVPVDGTATVTSVTDTVGIWDVINATGCKAIKVAATAGFAASDVTVAISSTQVGGSAGSTDVNVVTLPAAPSAGAAVVVTASAAVSTQILAANSARKGFICRNSDANPMLINLGNAAATTDAIQVDAATVTDNDDTYVDVFGYTGAVFAIWTVDGAGSAHCQEIQ